MSADRPRCGSCRFFEARGIDDAAAARALAVGTEIPPGLCRRYPQALRKLAHERCGEHKPIEAD